MYETLNELIEALQELAEQEDKDGNLIGELPVCIAYQKSWPLAEAIEAVTVADRDGSKGVHLRELWLRGGLMSITDELREWMRAHHILVGGLTELTEIANRIDVEHQKACDDAWNNGYEADYLGIEKWLTEHPQVMEHHGWVCLPKDADGEAWHIGDRTESGQTIEAMGLNKHGWHFVGTVNEIDPAIHRHYHAQTVEDVLREFAEKVIDSQIPSVHPTYEEAIAEYAAKLRLAEGEER